MKRKVLFPTVNTWVKQANSLRRIRVNAGEVCAFAEVAALASPSEVCRVVRATVLFGDDVVEVKRLERQMVFVQLAVLATTARVMADKLAQARGHYAAGCSAK